MSQHHVWASEVIKGKTFRVTLKTESELAFPISHTVAMTAVRPVQGFELLLVKLWPLSVHQDRSVKTEGASLPLL